MNHQTTSAVIAQAQASVGENFDVKGRVAIDQVFQLLRVLGILVSGITALLAYLPNRDLAGAIQFVRQSPDLVPAAVALAGMAALVYSNLKTRWNKQRLIVAAHQAPKLRVVSAK